MQTDYTPTPEDIEHFWARVDKSGGPLSCWPWTAGQQGDGYGILWWRKQAMLAHRVAWEISPHSDSDGLTVYHYCSNRLCCNPAHLFAIDNSERFWMKVSSSGGPDTCWEWQGWKNSEGYGMVKWNGHRASAHRIAWVLSRGPIPEGLWVSRRCKNPSCCNPSHLYIGDETEHFWERVDRSQGDDGCWLWTACKDRRGRGYLKWSGRNESAPRVAWMLLRGPIPDGQRVCHRCSNPACVNPKHLFVGFPPDHPDRGPARVARFWARVDKSAGPDGCWLWTARRNRKGYGYLRWGGPEMLAHRIAWELTNGPILDGLFALHKCDVPACVNPRHLYLGRGADNVRDKMERGRHRALRGEQASNCKLSDQQVAEIRRMYAKGDTTKSALARRFGVTPTHVANIVNRKSRRSP